MLTEEIRVELVLRKKLRKRGPYSIASFRQQRWSWMYSFLMLSFIASDTSNVSVVDSSSPEIELNFGKIYEATYFRHGGT